MHLTEQISNLKHLFLGVILKGLVRAKVPAPTQAHSSSPPPSPPPALSEATGLNATLNVSGQVRYLDALECSTQRCSGNGHCVENNGDTSCVCSLIYSGDSCQDNLLKSMQGPIAYGAAGICAGLVFIAVMAVVVKRKRSNTRSVDYSIVNY